MERRTAVVTLITAGGAVGVYVWLRRRHSVLKEASVREASKARNNPSLTADFGVDATFAESNNILLVLSEVEGVSGLAAEFFGTVVANVLTQNDTLVEKKTVFLVGDCSKASDIKLEAADRVYVVAELSHGFDGKPGLQPVSLGRVPIRVHGVGAYYRRFLEPEGDSFFHRVQAEHSFQSLTESTKPGAAHRTGIYLTPVTVHHDEAHFRLLRCSTNFSGATDGFGTSDTLIVDALNREADSLFGGTQAPLNHVLAQIYHNSVATDSHKQFKAAIKGHSDKTKDMPTNGIMAFVTFYDESSLARLEPLPANQFDYGVRKSGLSGLTRLHFRLKPAAAEGHDGRLPSQFSVTLYPNSVFFMPLSTNRLFTHEIRPGSLDAALLPTRMGYVVRCSATEVIHRDGHTFLRRGDDRLVPLEPSTEEGIDQLRAFYKRENASTEPVDYGDRFLFSMNEGDYLRPTLAASPPPPVVDVTPPLPVVDVTPPLPVASAHVTPPRAPVGAPLPPNGFRSLALPGGSASSGNPFEELLAPVRLEGVTKKGRRGAVLVRPDAARGCPIVRTTTKYAEPAQCFALAHLRLAELVQVSAGLPAPLNNALIEVYTNAYAKMGAHSDQAQDLLPGSAIAVFTCYRHPERATPPPRKLVIQPKAVDSGAGFEIPLPHNTVVTWSLETNQRFRHKIVLDTAASPPDNEWLGVTFRTSSTYVLSRAHGEAGQERAVFEDGTPLTLATDAQAKELYQLRGRENAELDFTYPPLPFTVSPSDILPPRPASITPDDGSPKGPDTIGGGGGDR